jgi:hypothetical protein
MQVTFCRKPKLCRCRPRRLTVSTTCTGLTGDKQNSFFCAEPHYYSAAPAQAPTLLMAKKIVYRRNLKQNIIFFFFGGGSGPSEPHPHTGSGANKMLRLRNTGWKHLLQNPAWRTNLVKTGNKKYRLEYRRQRCSCGQIIQQSRLYIS